MLQKPTRLGVKAKPFPSGNAGSVAASHGRKGRGWCPHAWRLLPTCPPRPARWVSREPQRAGTQPAHQLSRFHQPQVFGPPLGGGEKQKGSGEAKLEQLHYKPVVILPGSLLCLPHSDHSCNGNHWGLCARKTLCIHTENFPIATCWCARDTEEKQGTHSWAGSV